MLPFPTASASADPRAVGNGPAHDTMHDEQPHERIWWPEVASFAVLAAWPAMVISLIAQWSMWVSSGLIVALAVIGFLLPTPRWRPLLRPSQRRRARSRRRRRA